MKFTNKLNLPEPFINYYNKDTHEIVENKYSVTELLAPVREILLKRKYYNRIEVDVADIIPAMFGSAVHHILEVNTEKTDDTLPEEKITCEIDGCVISGRCDLINLKELTIEDYKTCSVNKVIKEDFEDWWKQGLIYAYIYFKSKGIIIRKIKFYAIMKDWSKVRVSGNYPKSAVYVYEYNIQDSDYDFIEKWLKNKLNIINSGILPECTESERWYTGTKYAVYKKVADKKASIVCDTETEAHNYIRNKCDGAGLIDIRKGESLKCKYYCDVCKFCSQYKGE